MRLSFVGALLGVLFAFMTLGIIFFIQQITYTYPQTLFYSALVVVLMFVCSLIDTKAK